MNSSFVFPCSVMFFYFPPFFPICCLMTSIIPVPSLLVSTSDPFFFPFALRSLTASPSNCPPVSGHLAEAKCFLLSRCRWDCNKACQWKLWVALSHAPCLLCVGLTKPLVPFLLDLHQLVFLLFIWLSLQTVLFDLCVISPPVSLVSVPTALSGT